MKKVEGKAQVTGEAEYTDDIEPGKSELFAAFVISTLASCEFDPDEINVDAAMVGKKIEKKLLVPFLKGKRIEEI